jgi:hypothetical protein
MIKPKPYKLVCRNCGYSKVVQPKSDVLSPIDMFRRCKQCEALMNKEPLYREKILEFIKRWF